MTRGEGKIPFVLDRLTEHAQHQGCLLDLAAETVFASPETLTLTGTLLAILVVLDTTIRQRVPLALARVHRWGHVVNILEVAAQVAVLVLAGLESTTADRAE